MSLTPAQLERAARLESSQQRLLQLSRMGPAQLQVLLRGDPADVALWIASAAECGLVVAQLSYGRMWLEGWGVARDAAAALRWFLRAAQRGDPEALNMLGRCHENGWGTAVDLSRAAGYYRASADAAHDWGQYNLGNLLFDGRGVTQDRRQAVLWYLRAAEQGHARAMNLVGRCLEEGWGCLPRPEDAAYWYRRSAECGYFRGQFNHAISLLRGGRSAAAAQWFERVARAGNPAVHGAIVAALSRTSDPLLLEIRAQCGRASAEIPG